MKRLVGMVGLLTLAACSENQTSPSQPALDRGAAALSSVQSGTPVRVMRMRGAPIPGGVGSLATGINYHGGPILTQTKVQAIYWATGTIYAGGPAAGTTGTGAQDNSLVGYFLRNLGGSPYFNINTTYTDAVAGGHTVQNSVTYTGFYADNTSVPPANGSTVSDPTIQAEIIKGFTNGSLTYDAQTIYAVFTTGNTNLGGGFGSQYCAYHGNFLWNGNLVIYAAQPYVAQFPTGCGLGFASPNADLPADLVINVLAHEVEESTTDYALNAWYDTFGYENADKCAWNFGTTYNNGTGTANMKLGTKDFLIQQNWVNAGSGGCLLSWGGTTNQPPVANFTFYTGTIANPTCTVNMVCTLDGTSSTDDVGVTGYSWKLASGMVVSTSPTFTKTFTAATSVPLTLTVTDAGGLTNSITKTLVVGTGGGGNQPPVAKYTWSCNASHFCSFDGTSSTDDVGVVSWSWTTSTGSVVASTSTFTKQFTAAKTFSLTLKVTDGGGLNNSTTKTIIVP